MTVSNPIDPTNSADTTDTAGTATAAKPTVLNRRNTLKAGALALAASAVTIGGATTQARAAVPGLTEIFNVRVNARWWDFRFNTTAMTLFPPSVRVILPDGYDQNPGRRYPVLLLLHGGHAEGVNPAQRFPGAYKDWTEHGGIADRQTVGKDVIILCPDGGNGGFYVNWKGPQGAKVNWEEFHIPQLLNWADQRLRTIVGWKTKAVAGLSMGGYGAMVYAARNPQVFSSASAYSGALDVFDINQIAVMTGSPVSDGQLPGSIFQADTGMMQQWNPRALAGNLRGLRLFVSSGDGNDGNPASWIQESTARRTNDAFVGDLRARGIGVDYRFMRGGGHVWPNWNYFFGQDINGILAALPHQ